MSDERSHYEVLGLPHDCTADQIKKRFRELARQYHPDRNRERPDAHELFLRINEAYEVLSDESRRAVYDFDLNQRARRQAPRGNGTPGYGAGAPPGAGPRRPPGPGGSAPGGPGPVGGARADFRARREAEQRRQMAASLLAQARDAFSRGRLGESRRLCEEVLQFARVGAAYELLGDIYSRQGRIEPAIQNYTLAAQLQPQNNGLIMSKLNKLDARRTGRVRSTPGAPVGAPPGRSVVYSRRQRLYQLALSSFGLAVIILLISLAPAMDANRLEWFFVPDWTVGHLTALCVTGFVAGCLLAAAGWVGRIDEELLAPHVGIGRLRVPVGTVIGTAALVSLPASLGLYLIIGRLQESLSGSVVTYYVCAFILTFVFSMNSPEAASGQTLLFAGNVLFIFMLFGWFMGDLFRPDWRD